MNKTRIALIKEVEDTKRVDTKIFDFIVGQRQLFDTLTVEYDVVDMKSVTAQFKKFSETAEVVERDGKKVVRLDVFEINRKILNNVLSDYERQVGSSEYETLDQQKKIAMARAINEKVHDGAVVRRKLLIASILTNLSLSKAIDQIDADFGIDVATQRMVKTTGLWTAANAPVIADLKALKEKSKGSVYIMNSNTYTNMLNNGDLRIGSDTDGKGLNFKLNDGADGAEEFYKIGKIIDPVAMGDIYIWDSGDDAVAQYIADGMVVCTRPSMIRAMFGGLPYKGADSKEWITELAEWNVMKVVGEEIPYNGVIYRSAPMYAPLSTWKISVLKTY